MQISKKNEFIATPDWYYNVEYTEERNRGYDYREDLFVPGYFEFPIKKGESIVFSASVDAVAPSRLKTKFQKLVDGRAPRDSFENCLKYSASQFIVRRGKETEIVAGYFLRSTNNRRISTGEWCVKIRWNRGPVIRG